MPYRQTGNPVGRPPKDHPLLTYSFKCPEDLWEEAKEYAWKHRTSVGELLREGLKWRLEEGDPLAYRSVAPPAQEKNGIPVIPVRVTTAPLDAAALGDGESAPPPAPRTLDYDPTRYVLGKLCPGTHAYRETGQTLLTLIKKRCLLCESAKKREQRLAKRLVEG